MKGGSISIAIKDLKEAHPDWICREIDNARVEKLVKSLQGGVVITMCWIAVTYNYGDSPPDPDNFDLESAKPLYIFSGNHRYRAMKQLSAKWPLTNSYKEARTLILCCSPTDSNKQMLFRLGQLQNSLENFCEPTSFQERMLALRAEFVGINSKGKSEKEKRERTAQVKAGYRTFWPEFGQKSLDTFWTMISVERELWEYHSRYLAGEHLAARAKLGGKKKKKVGEDEPKPKSWGDLVHLGGLPFSRISILQDVSRGHLSWPR
jgi:uncharacterized ParB-like nuclease family protein